jgi:hypothetical protein
VATVVELELAESWKPLVSSNSNATTTIPITVNKRKIHAWSPGSGGLLEQAPRAPTPSNAP